MTPTSEAQLDFLKQLQRVFNEGQFVATYKFALLHAIADICVERNDDAAGRLHIPLEDLGNKFLELYWRHAAPYRTHVLKASPGRQAAIINDLVAQRRAYGTLGRFRSSKDWQRRVRATTQLIRNMPLMKLQILGGQVNEFLYPNRLIDQGIALQPGIAFCFRAFHPLVQSLVREHWVRQVRTIPANSDAVGRTGDLEAFLFGSQRRALTEAGRVLKSLQKDRCFYCKRPVQDEGQVDHFIPWSRYPRDLGHNFVLAHASCNRDKRDTLAARPHVECWKERNEIHGKALKDELSGTFIFDRDAIYRVAAWSYGQDRDAGARLWLSPREYASFDQHILSLF